MAGADADLPADGFQPPTDPHYKDEDIKQLLAAWTTLQDDPEMEHTSAWRQQRGLHVECVIHDGKLCMAYVTPEGTPLTKQFTKKGGETVTYVVPVEQFLLCEVKPRAGSFPFGNAQPGQKYLHANLATASMGLRARTISPRTSPEAAAASKRGFDEVLAGIESYEGHIFRHMAKHPHPSLLWTQPEADSDQPPTKRVTASDFRDAVRDMQSKAGKCAFGRPPAQRITYEVMCKIRQQSGQPPPSEDEFEEFASLAVDAYFSEVVFGNPNVKALDKASEREAPPLHCEVARAIRAYNAEEKNKLKRVYKPLPFTTPSGARLPLPAFDPDVCGGLLCIARIKWPRPMVTAVPGGKGNTVPVGQPLLEARLPPPDTAEFVAYATKAGSKKEEGSIKADVADMEEDAEYVPSTKKRTPLADFAQRIKRSAESDGEPPPKRAAPGPTPDFPDNH